MAQITQVEKRGGLFELTEEARTEITGSKYYNSDLAPTSVAERTWTTYNITALWVGMSICIPSLSLSSAAIAMGLSPWLAVLNVTLGNVIILIPMQMNSHIGTRYGIPFPIFARLTFGTFGAHLTALSRAIVACGWCSVQSWVGGGAVAAILGCVIPFFSDSSITIGLPGNPSVVVGQVIGFFLFMLFTLWVAYNGLENIKWVQNIGAPILVVVMLLLLAWSAGQASSAGYSFGEVMQQKSDWDLVNACGGFGYVFCACLTGNIAFWATLALNIPDFSRYCKSQSSQFRGQMYGMPLPMFGCAFIGAYFAQSTKISMGTTMFDPTGVFYYVDNKLLVLLAAVGVVAATITTCVAANVVAPANGISNIAPQKISYKKGIIITCIVATFVMQPWWIYGSGAAYVFTWLNNYGTILAPVAAILIADYYVVKRKKVALADLYKGPEGRYHYHGGWNWAAIIAWVASFIIPLAANTVFLYDASTGAAPGLFDWLAANGYFTAFAIGFFLYWALMSTSLKCNSTISDEDFDKITKKLA